MYQKYGVRCKKNKTNKIKKNKTALEPSCRGIFSLRKHTYVLPTHIRCWHHLRVVEYREIKLLKIGPGGCFVSSRYACSYVHRISTEKCAVRA